MKRGRNLVAAAAFVVVAVSVLAQDDPSIVLNDGGIQFSDGSVQSVAAGGPPAPAEQTGQTQCFDASGIEITCTGTGQDGDLRKGVKWPAQRFVHNGDGTVTDKLTGLVWLMNANCFGTRTWEQALGDANGMADPDCGLSDGSTAGDWRLPNVKEMQSLIDYGHGGPALPSDHPFTGVVNDDYWTSTSRNDAFGPADAWTVNLNGGGAQDEAKSGVEVLWPVRGGQ